MSEISNRTLATLLVAAIVISLSGTIVSLNKLSDYVPLSGPTGRAPSDTGTTSVTVQQAVSIILQNPPGFSVDFGTGRVNASKAGCGVRANMLALADGTNYTDTGDCWIEISQPTEPVGWRLENDGNLNASINVRGPSEAAFFSGYAGVRPTILRWRSNLSDGGCPSGGNESWSAFDWNSTLCENLPWDEGQYDDDLGIDVNLTVPSDLTSGTYSDSNIEFYGVPSIWS